MSNAKHTPGLVKVRISATIDNEYANRLPDWMTEENEPSEGVNHVPLNVARMILSDAEYNSDPQAQTVGPYDMPLPVFNAYKALAKQVRAAIAKATGSAA